MAWSAGAVESRLRVLLVVRPALYEASLSSLLERADADEITCASYGGNIEGSYDVAVVTGTVPADVDTEVVIRLPSTETGTGVLTVSDRHGSSTVIVTDLRQVLEAIDSAISVGRRRTDTFVSNGPHPHRPIAPTTRHPPTPTPTVTV